MKKRKLFFYLFPFLIPILGMILTNEYSQHIIHTKGHQIKGITAINSAQKLKDNCSWICHNNTNFCKQHHVKFAKPFFKITDPIYFGLINSLKSTGNYGLANVLVLGILLPLLILFLFLKSIRMQTEIRQLKNQ